MNKAMADKFFGITDKGKLRDNNEDAFIASQMNKLVIACVIDGVGGYAGGEIAAAIARDAIQEQFKEDVPDVEASMIAGLQRASYRIFEKKKQVKEYQQMACVITLAIADIDHNQFYYAHIGDTRLYLLHNRSLVKVTKDHSFVGFLEDRGCLSETEAMNHPKRNEIDKALGFGYSELKPDYIETRQLPFLPGDMLMLCSDGLTDLVNKQEITEILSRNTTLAQKCTELVQAANNKGGKDNITVVVVKNDNPPVKSLPATSDPITRDIRLPAREIPVKKEPLKGEKNILATPGSNKYKYVTIVLALLGLILIFLLTANFNEGKKEEVQPADATGKTSKDSLGKVI